jgi:hypothetical protein
LHHGDGFYSRAVTWLGQEFNGWKGFAGIKDIIGGGNSMDKCLMRQQLEDFTQFCDTINPKRTINAAGHPTHVPDDDKVLYAMAIIRAAKNGAFGDDNKTTQTAISALWERGYLSGFNTDSFNVVFEEYFRYW